MSDSDHEDREHDEERLRKIEETIALYQDAWLDLIRIGVVLIEQGRDLTGMKETIDGLGEREVKELLLVSAATAARDNVEMRRAAGRN